MVVMGLGMFYKIQPFSLKVKWLDEIKKPVPV